VDCDHGRSPSIKKYYLEPHHPSVSLMDVQKDFGENKRDKDNQHRVELALLGFDCQVANRPLSWIGVLPLHVGYLFETSDSKKPEHLLAGTSLGFDYMKKEKYICEYERGGVKVAKVNLPLS
jgi:hypothetical protein